MHRANDSPENARNHLQNESWILRPASQGAYSQIERNSSNQVETLRRLAKVLACVPAQLTMD